MYNFNPSELPVGIDCDQTLIKWVEADIPGPGKIEFDYYGTKVYLTPHNYHVAIVKSYFHRGYYNRVWSANGPYWAKQVVDKLGLQDHVHEVCCKLVKCLDDTTNPGSITGPLIFEPDDLLKTTSSPSSKVWVLL